VQSKARRNQQHSTGSSYIGNSDGLKDGESNESRKIDNLILSDV